MVSIMSTYSPLATAPSSDPKLAAQVGEVWRNTWALTLSDRPHHTYFSGSLLICNKIMAREYFFESLVHGNSSIMTTIAPQFSGIY